METEKAKHVETREGIDHNYSTKKKIRRGFNEKKRKKL